MKSRFQARFKLTLEEYLRLARPRSPAIASVISSVLAVLILVALLLFLLRNDETWVRYGAATLSIPLLFILPVLDRRRHTRHYRDDPTVSAQTAIELHDEGLNFDNGLVRVAMPWSDIVRAEARDGLLLLVTARNQYHVIPERALGLREQVEACRDFIRDKVERVKFGAIQSEQRDSAAVPAVTDEPSPPGDLTNARPRIPDPVRYAANALLFCAFFGAMFLLVGAFMPAKPVAPKPHWMYYYMIASMVVFTAASLAAGILLLRGRPAGRRAAYVVFPFLLPAIPLGPIVAPVAWWFLTRPESQRYFDAISPRQPELRRAADVRTGIDPIEGVIEVRGELSPREVTILFRASPGGSRIVLFLGVVIMGAQGVVQMLLSTATPRVIAMNAGLLVLLALAVAAQLYFSARSARTQSRSSAGRVYLISEAGIDTIDRDLNQTADWSLIRRAATVDQVILLFNPAGQVIVGVPHRHFQSDQLNAVRAMIRLRVVDCSQL